jgi:hypothetical protein
MSDLVNAESVSVEIPRRGSLLSFQVMEDALTQAELLPGTISGSWALSKKQGDYRGYRPTGPNLTLTFTSQPESDWTETADPRV